MLGFAAIGGCGDDYIGKAEYGCPHADFEAKGRVTDEDGNPIKGIAVRGSWYPEAVTDHDGKFEIDTDELITDGKTVPFMFVDIDGADNGGYFETVKTDVDVVRVSEPDKDDDWDLGDYAAAEYVDVVMKKGTMPEE